MHTKQRFNKKSSFIFYFTSSLQFEGFSVYFHVGKLSYVKNGIEPDNIGLVALTIYDTTNTKNFDHTKDPQVTVGDYGEY